MEYNRKWGSAVCSEAIKEASLVETALFRRLGNQRDRGRRTDAVQSRIPPYPHPVPLPSRLSSLEVRAFIDRGSGGHAEIAESVPTVILKSVTSNLTNNILIVLSTVNLHFQGCSVSISLRPVL